MHRTKGADGGAFKKLEDPRTRERNVIPPRQFPALFRFCSSQCPVLSAQRRVPIDWRPVLEEGNLNSEVPPTTPQNLERGHSLKKVVLGLGGWGASVAAENSSS